MTPITRQADLTNAMLRYNNAQTRTRSLIERCNGLLKMRFRCLSKNRVLHYQPVMCSKIINACVVLHNMCIANRVPMPEDDDEDEIDLELFADEVNEDENRNEELTAGRRARNALIRQYFQR